MNENTAHKGDVVALEITSTSWHLAKGHERSSSWTLAYVESATRDGMVKCYRVAGMSYAMNIKHCPAKVYCVNSKPEYHAKARKLADGMSYPPTEYESAQDLRKAILAA